MKRGILLLILSLLLMSSIVSAGFFTGVWGDYLTGKTVEETIEACTDSDGGININIKGETLGWDNCLGDIPCGSYNTKIDSCYSDNIRVVEWYCKNKTHVVNTFSCPNGCKDGACVTATTTTSCTDSDGGKNYNIKGSTTGYTNTPPEIKTFIDACQKSTDSLGTNYPEGDLLVEWSCNNDNYVEGVVGYKCPNGCKDGACVTVTTTTSCTETDKGLDPFTKGICNGKYADYCNPYDSGYVEEYYCLSSSPGCILATGTPCPSGTSCKDGACISSSDVILTTGVVKEQVKCVFNNPTINSKYECYSSVGVGCIAGPINYESPNIACVADVSGEKGASLIWKSTCGGYAYTTMDGVSEYAEFSCASFEIITPTEETTGLLTYRFYDTSLSPKPLPEDITVADVWLDKQPENLMPGDSVTLWVKAVGSNGMPLSPENKGSVVFTFVSDAIIEQSGGWKLLMPYTEMLYDNEKGYYFYKFTIPRDLSKEAWNSLRILIDVSNGKVINSLGTINSVRFIGAFRQIQQQIIPEPTPISECQSPNSLTYEQIICLDNIFNLNEKAQVCDAEGFVRIPQFNSCTESQVAYLVYSCIYTGLDELKDDLSKCNLPEPIFMEPPRVEEITQPPGYIGPPISTCNGCLMDNKCLPYGTRLKGTYCNINNELSPQQELDGACDNSYECKSNECSNNQCISTAGLLQKLLDFLSRLFGKE